MRMLTSPIRYVRKRRARQRQIRTVLHMLSVSGVVRPSHVEPRYCEPPSEIDALYRQHANGHIIAPGTRPRPSVAHAGAALDWTKFRHWVGTFKPSSLQMEQ